MGVEKNLDGPATPASGRIDWGDLRIFLHVAETGSLSAAAKGLQLSQPTVSQRVRELETRLNTQLLARGPQGVVLTEAGQRIREHAEAMQRAAFAIDRELRQRDGKNEGRVRLSAPDGLAAFWIAPRLAAFQRVNPQISVSLDCGIWPDDPLREELDVSLQYDARNFGDHVVEPIATVHYAPFASESYLALYGTPRTLAEMATHRTIHHSAVKQQKETWDPKAEAMRTLSDWNIETNSSAVLTFAVMAGAGISYLPTGIACVAPGLVMLGESAAASPILYLVYSPHVARIARIARLIEWLKDVFSPRANPGFAAEFIHPRHFALRAGAGRFELSTPEI